MAHDQLYMALVCSIPDPGYRTWTHGGQRTKVGPEGLLRGNMHVAWWRQRQARDGGTKIAIEPCVANSTGRSNIEKQRYLVYAWHA